MPLYTRLALAFRAGALPTWAPGLWSGQPLATDPQLGVFYPPHWLLRWVDPLTFYASMTLIHALLAAWAMASWARLRGASRVGAALAAVSFALGAFFVMRLRHASFTNTTVWLVWALGTLERARHGMRPRLVWALALQVALAVLAGGWQLLPFGAMVFAATFVSGLVTQPRGRSGRAAGVLVGVALALGLAAVQLVPSGLHLAESPRGRGVTEALAGAYAWPSWRYALSLVMPMYFGDEALGTYVGAPNPWEMCGWGSGLVATLFALASLLRRRRRGERLVLVALLLLSCDLARGDAGLAHQAHRLLPLVSSLRGPTRALYGWVLVVPLLAADGYDVVRAWLRAQAPRLAPVTPALFLLCIVELLSTWSTANPTSRRAEAQSRPEAVQFLALQRSPHRVATHRLLPRRFHNGLAAWGLENAGGYHSLPIWRYLHFLWIVNFQRPYATAQLNHDLGTHGPWRSASPLLDLLDVGWLIAPHGHAPRAEHFRLAHLGRDGVDVWQNTHPLTRARVVFRTRTVPDAASAARALAAADFDPLREAIVESPQPLSTDRGAAPAALGEARWLHTAPTRSTAEVTLSHQGFVVLSEPWYPGWRLTVDGADAPLRVTDLALCGAALAPGHHRLVMTFTLPGLALGAWLSASTVLILSLWALYVWRRERRGPARHH